MYHVLHIVAQQHVFDSVKLSVDLSSCHCVVNANNCSDP